MKVEIPHSDLATAIKTQPDDTLTRVLILAAGQATRWGKYLGGPKHLAPIDGQALTGLMQEKLRALGAKDIRLLVADDAPDKNATIINPNPDGQPSDKFLSSRAYWNPNGPTALVFGDVYFSDTALAEIFTTTPNTVRFIGRLTPSSFTGGRHKEIFALTFGPEIHETLEAELRALPSKSTRPTGWMLYRHLQRQSGRPDAVGVVFSHIDDMTEDFDRPEDYDNWQAQRQKSRSTNIFKRNRRMEKLHILAGMLIGGAAAIILSTGAFLLL